MHLKLENFDGPLDLLLHLIKAQELNIFNIPIAMITEQYLVFVKQAQTLDFHTAGEYLAIAAQLIEMKANLLVPILQNTLAQAQTLEEIPEGDPRRPLVEQLLEFEALKKASELLGAQSLAAQDIFPSNEYKRREEEFSLFEFPIKGNPLDLVIAFERVLLDFSNYVKPKVIVHAQKITIQQKMQIIKKRLQELPSVTFRTLISECSSRYEFIIVFMALLELCKANHLNVAQQEDFSEIEITRGVKFFDENVLIQ